MDEERPDLSNIAEDECSVCGSYDIVTVDAFGYPFCGQHDHRAALLARGRQWNWPALRIEGAIETYAIDNDWQAYILSVFFGTDDRVFALLEALDEHEERLAQAS